MLQHDTISVARQMDGFGWYSEQSNMSSNEEEERRLAAGVPGTRVLGRAEAGRGATVNTHTPLAITKGGGG